MADAEFLAALRSNAVAVQRDLCSLDQVRRLIYSKAVLDARLWNVAAELGWLALAVPEAYGGMGAGVAEIGALQEVLGAHVAPIPFLGTALLSLALADWPDEPVRAQLFPQIMEGAIIGGISDFEGAAPLNLGGTDQGLLNGITSVVDGAAADWLLVHVAAANQQQGFALVSADARGVSRERIPLADATRSVAKLSCSDTPIDAAHILLGPQAELLLGCLRRSTALLIACDSVGGTEAIFAETVEYLKSRVQFGKPIGAFQALKHRAADLKVDIEVARQIASAALEQADEGGQEIWAPMAKFTAAETYVRVASEALQMHGAIGYTWEHRAHLYLKRASLNATLFGGLALQQDRVGELLGMAGRR